MKSSTFTLTLLALLAVTAWPQYAAAQEDRDFVFTDQEGLLVLRYAGSGPRGLDADQLEEIVNVQLSTMVHDRLRADAVFEAEAVDTMWAELMESRIKNRLGKIRPEFSAIKVECKTTYCRLVFEHSSKWNIPEHQSMMSIAQLELQGFIEDHPTSFETVFLIAAHFQEPDNAYLKLFLQRATSQN